MSGIVSFIVEIIIAIFLYVDAPKHNKSPWLWAILGFFFGPFALGIYFIKTGRKVVGWIMVIIVGLLYLAFIVLVVLAAVLFANGFGP
ncbi:hypothetical protein AA0X95_03445 [Bacillus sp. 1P10SD]|jgi:hypothetical protein|uniref:hypothetical protein n=1 Tax=Bacillus sp. 1P10SD TaxID=3132265 RepID=UPI0039A72FB6